LIELDYSISNKLIFIKKRNDLFIHFQHFIPFLGDPNTLLLSACTAEFLSLFNEAAFQSHIHTKVLADFTNFLGLCYT
jgi:hypothetical protein